MSDTAAEARRWAIQQKVPAELARELIRHFESVPRDSVDSFLGRVLPRWEYELLYGGETDTDTRLEDGWHGLLAVLDAEVPDAYAHALRTNYSLPVRGRTIDWGYQDVISFHRAGVPVEYVAVCNAAGLQHVDAVLRAFADGISAEYLAATR